MYRLIIVGDSGKTLAVTEPETSYENYTEVMNSILSEVRTRGKVFRTSNGRVLVPPSFRGIILLEGVKNE